MSDTNHLLSQIFILAAWGLDSKERQEEIEQLMLSAIEHGSTIVEQAQKAKNQGIQANQLNKKLISKFQQHGETEIFLTWFNGIQNNNSIPHRVKKHLTIVLDKQRKQLFKAQQKQSQRSAECLVCSPIINKHQPHPNSLRHLAPNHHWDIVIDETGNNFEDVEELNISDQSVGRYVALAVPSGVKLQALSANFHATDESHTVLDTVINDILSKPVGVLGLSLKDPLSYQRPRWLSGIYRLLQLTLRLLPLDTTTNQQKCVNIFIEQRGIFNQETNLDALRHLLLSELQSINEQYYQNLTLHIKIVRKGEHRYLPHVDALAHCWGGSSAKRRLQLAQFKGHCFLNPQDEDIGRIYAKLNEHTMLTPADWYLAITALAQEPEYGLLHQAMQQLGEQCQQHTQDWLNYLQEIQYRLNNKQSQTAGLEAALNWLAHYQPAQQKLPPLLKLRWLAARLAGDNHMGRMDISSVSEILDLGASLVDEAASEVGQIYARLAVAATNVYEFEHAQTIIDHALNIPAVALGRLTYGKLLSSKGQIYAFLHQYEQANHYFEQAIHTFHQLSDPMAAAKDIRQTQIYQLVNHINQRTAWVNIEPTLHAVLGSNDLAKATKKLACSNRPEERFAHHLLLRVLAYYPEAHALAEHYLQQLNQWSNHEGHPWQLIHFWRGWLAHQQGNTTLAQDAFRAALTCEPQAGATLRWIALVCALLIQHLGYQTDYPIAAQQQQLKQDLPHAPHHALTQLSDYTSTPESLSAWLETCLPFNFK